MAWGVAACITSGMDNGPDTPALVAPDAANAAEVVEEAGVCEPPALAWGAALSTPAPVAAAAEGVATTMGAGGSIIPGITPSVCACGVCPPCDACDCALPLPALAAMLAMLALPPPAAHEAWPNIKPGNMPGVAAPPVGVPAVRKLEGVKGNAWVLRGVSPVPGRCCCCCCCCCCC